MRQHQQHTVEIYLDAQRQFRWRRTALNGRIIAASGEGYSELHECHEAVFRVFGVPWTIFVAVGPPLADPYARGDRDFEDQAVKDEDSW